MIKKTKKELWLISKHGNDVGDNAFAFFKYMVKSHPEIRSIYVADKACKKDWEAAKAVGETVQFRSFRHKFLFMTARKIVTSHVGDSEPWDYGKVIHMREKHPNWAKKHKIVHLQHGVIDKNVSHIYDRSKRPVDLFICSSEEEKMYIMESLHYDETHIALTGLARFDELYGSKPEKFILLIPRYRREVMVQLPENKRKLKYHFMNSRFYKKYQELINNEETNKVLEKYGYKMIFYPHYEVQPLIDCFHTKSVNVIIANRDQYELDELLKKSALMITDYSSVAFDFGFMKRPVIYYQFDQDEFESEHGGSYFEHSKDGFGPVVYELAMLNKTIEDFVSENGNESDTYIGRCEKSFKYMDNKNCERVFRSIISIV